jgi:hypothetical protein
MDFVPRNSILEWLFTWKLGECWNCSVEAKRKANKAVNRSCRSRWNEKVRQSRPHLLPQPFGHNSKEQIMHGSLAIFRFMSTVLVLACPTLALADEREAKAQETLDGTWQVDVSDTQVFVLSIKGSDIELSTVTGEKLLPVWVGKLSVSGDERNQHMDWVQLRSGNTRLPDNKCLFRLRGDVLLVIGGGPNKRPTKFLSGSGSDPKTLVFIRTKPETKEAEPNAEP